jgi:hypothetical protein
MAVDWGYECIKLRSSLALTLSVQLCGSAISLAMGAKKMAFSLEVSRGLDAPVSDTLKTLCCDPLTFMWVNSLLAARDEWHMAGYPGKTVK